MGSDIDPGQAHDGGQVQGDGAAGLAEMGEGGGAQGDGDAGVPGQVAEPGGFATVDASLPKQGRRPGPAHHLLEDLGQCPGAGAARQEPPGEFAVPGQPCRAGRRGGGAEGAQFMTAQAGGYS